jgi:8-oxo-dGTP pyrophosphatase MutT (NUDIX family)
MIAAAIDAARREAFEEAAARIRKTASRMYEHARGPYEHAAGVVELLAKERGP